MPRTRSLAWSELKIGVLTIVALVITAVLIFALSGSRGFFWDRYSLKTRFTNVSGLAPGSPVRVAGQEVGTVRTLEFAGDQVDVGFDLNKKVRGLVTTNSVAKLGSVSLLGEGAVDITPSTTGTPIPDFGYVPAGRAPAQFSDLTEQASQGIDEINKLAHDIRTGHGTVGKLMTDDRLYNELHQFVASANDLTSGLRRGQGTLGRLLKDPKAAQSLEASLANIETLTQQLNSGQGSLGKLLKDEAFANSLAAATANLRDLTARINSGEGTVGRLMTDRALYDRLTSVTTRLDELVGRLNAGEGTAGQLLKDQRLYENMNKVTTELSSFLAEVKKDPKKYLNVKISIF
ncbi:MAG TPA: MlaD family protein [Vicinamibacterales bacterium]|jgi:phospholipid/cholesterol/gamma-HCH transport system substrate-binding protein|nr:MlaD family protein [Vicinamibacterales bacterium]